MEENFCYFYRRFIDGRWVYYAFTRDTDDPDYVSITETEYIEALAALAEESEESTSDKIEKLRFDVETD